MSAPATMSPGIPWGLDVGEAVVRADLHAAYGGRPSPRISPSRGSPNVMLFLSPAADEARGLVCGTHPDGCLHVAGEGGSGDQNLSHGNGAVLGAAASGKAIRVFLQDAPDGLVAYQGEFLLDTEEPLYWTDAQDGDCPGPARSVAVFRLRPTQGAARLPPTSLAAPPRPEAERVAPRPFPTVGRSMSVEALVAGYADEAERRGGWVERIRLLPGRGERVPVTAHLSQPGRRRLLVARSTTSRAAFRCALGELADLRRLVEAGGGTVLLPQVPRPDLIALAASMGVEVAWPRSAADRERWTTSVAAR